MPAHDKYLSPEERAEYAQAIDDALNGSQQADVAAIDRLEDYMAQADRAGRQWPGLIYRQLIREGLRGVLKSRAKARSRILVDFRGQLVGKDARRGVLVTGADGREVWQQKLFDQMTWDEFDQWERRNDEQITALEINRVMAQKIRALQMLVPDSSGPADACARLGTTLEDVLAA
jgi:hypothetical protein